MSRKIEPVELPPLSEDQVVDYLLHHPDLLNNRPDIIALLVPPSRFAGGTVLDLQQFMIGRLSHEIDSLRGCAEHLITTSRNNMSTQSRTHEAVLAVLAAGDMDGLSRVVGEDLPTLLDVDIATMGFESARPPDGIESLPEGLLERSLGSGDVMLRAQAEGDVAIFGAGASLVSSFALVRLEPRGLPQGLLALGSRNERAFHSSQGTELLAFVARILEDCVARWWPEI
jgi:uncharacterized protein YigA (DUF484 family)